MANHRRLLRIFGTLTSLILLLLLTSPAKADIAPPESPSGGNPSPGKEVTHTALDEPTATPAALARLPVEPEASLVSLKTQAEARGLGNLPGGSIALCVGAFIPILVLVAVLRALSKKGQK